MKVYCLASGVSGAAVWDPDLDLLDVMKLVIYDCFIHGSSGNDSTVSTSSNGFMTEVLSTTANLDLLADYCFVIVSH